MKATTKFIVIYFSCFFASATLAVLFFGDPNNHEMMGLTIAGCIYYAIVGSIAWYIIYASANKIENNLTRFATLVISGFVLLDGLLYVTDGATNTKYLIFINAIHLLCFLTAFAISRKRKSNHEDTSIITN